MAQGFRGPVIYISPRIQCIPIYIEEKTTYPKDHDVVDFSRHGKGKYKMRDAG
jgi:hypothetical protein